MGQAEDGCDSQMDAGVWVSAAQRVWEAYLVQHGHLEKPQEQRVEEERLVHPTPCRLAAAGVCSAPQGSILQHSKSPLTPRPLLPGC